MKSFLIFISIILLAFSIPYVLGIQDGVPLKNKQITIGTISKKNYGGKSSSTLEIKFKDSNGKQFNAFLDASDNALSVLPINFPFYVEYDANNPLRNRVDRFTFPKELIGDSLQSVMGEIAQIKKIKVYGSDLKFKGYWEIYYDYYVNNKPYKGLLFSKERPGLNISEQFWVVCSKENLKIGYLDLNNPFSDKNILDMIQKSIDSMDNIEGLIRDTSTAIDLEIIEGDTVQVLHID